MKTKILKFLEKKPESSASAIANSMGVERTAVIRVLNEMRTDQLVECEKGKGNALYYWLSGVSPEPVQEKPATRTDSDIASAQIKALKEANDRMEAQLRAAESLLEVWVKVVGGCLGVDTPALATERIKSMTRATDLIGSAAKARLRVVNFADECLEFDMHSDSCPYWPGMYALVQLDEPHEAEA